MRLYADGTLRTTGEIQITGSKVINFGYDQTKADGATGRIGYGTYEANSLNIVGGSTTGERKISMWDWVNINGRISTTGNANFNGNVGIATTPDSFMKLDVNGNTRISGELFGAQNLVKRSTVLFTPIKGGDYYYSYTINYDNYVSSNGTEYAFRVYVYDNDDDVNHFDYLIATIFIRKVYEPNNYTYGYYGTVINHGYSGMGQIPIIADYQPTITFQFYTLYSGNQKRVVFENIADASS